MEWVCENCACSWQIRQGNETNVSPFCLATKTLDDCTTPVWIYSTTPRDAVCCHRRLYDSLRTVADEHHIAYFQHFARLA